MQIPFLAKLIFLITLISISYFSKKYSQNKEIVNKAEKAKPVN